MLSFFFKYIFGLPWALFLDYVPNNPSPSGVSNWQFAFGAVALLIYSAGAAWYACSIIEEWFESDFCRNVDVPQWRTSYFWKELINGSFIRFRHSVFFLIQFLFILIVVSLWWLWPILLLGAYVLEKAIDDINGDY